MEGNVSAQNWSSIMETHGKQVMTIDGVDKVRGRGKAVASSLPEIIPLVPGSVAQVVENTGSVKQGNHSTVNMVKGVIFYIQAKGSVLDLIMD
ncbi:hypothetical protein V6N11_054544 [Hibiscus sabdariffa]